MSVIAACLGGFSDYQANSACEQDCDELKEK
jgi:hypothetical protein